MITSLVVVVIPYLLSILLRVSTLILDEGSMLEALENLVGLPRTPSAQPALTRDQCEVIVKHLAHASLKNTTILTTFTSSFAAMAVIFETHRPWSAGLLIVFLFFGIALLWWVIPKKVYYFDMNGLWGIRRDRWLTMWFCFYDLILMSLSLYTVLSVAPGHK